MPPAGACLRGRVATLGWKAARRPPGILCTWAAAVVAKGERALGVAEAGCQAARMAYLVEEEPEAVYLSQTRFAVKVGAEAEAG